jgi:UDP-GlcNAc:undecaprenyl-phosphate/decaprenyl-phosphate GlcNAc-1-phosphate transferase
MLFIYLFFFSTLFLYSSFRFSKKFQFFDIPDGKKIHKQKTPNLGGMALIPFIFLIIYLFEYNQIILITLNLLCIVIIIGLIDDIENINPQIKLLALFIPIYIFTKDVGTIKSLGFYMKYEIFLGSLSFLFTVLCMLLLTNAYNYIDGLDGLLAINVIITFLTLYFLINGQKNIFFPFIIFFIIYFLFNINFLKFFPKQFIGDSGSLGIGFLISAFLIIYTQKENYLHSSIIIWTVAFVVYEFLAINIIRIKKGKNIFKRDLNFIFNVLSKKYSSTKSLIICSSIHLTFCFTSILMNFLNSYLLSIILFITFFCIYIIFRFKQIFGVKI